MVSGAMENLPSVSTSAPAHDPLDDDLLPWEGQKSDDEAEDKSSDLSSCGESEFERYCSANSALGTPSSVCNSSVYEFADSEFGSFESFKLRGERRSLKSSAVDKKLLHFSDTSRSRSTTSELCDVKRRRDEPEFKGVLGMSKGIEFYGCPDAFLNDREIGLVRNDIFGLENIGVEALENGNSWNSEGNRNNANLEDYDGHLLNLGNNCGPLEARENGEGSAEPKCENKLVSSSHYSDRIFELADDHLEGLDLQPALEFHGSDVERCSDEFELSSRDEHSEVDDSMSDGVSDNGKKDNVNCVTDKQDLTGNRLAKNENGLFMSSAEAFGQDDWDDFMQETMESPLNMILQDEFLGKKQKGADVEIGCQNSASATTTGLSGIDFKENDELVNISKISYQIQGTAESEKPVNTPLSDNLYHMKFDEPGQKCALDNQLRGVNDFTEYPASKVECRNYKMGKNLPREVISSDVGLSITIDEQDKGNGHKGKLKATSVGDNFGQEQVELEEINFLSDPLSDVFNQLYSAENMRDQKPKILEENDPSSMQLLSDKNTNSVMKNSPVLLDHFEDHFSPVKVNRGNPQLNEFFDEMVHDMEEILLDTRKSPTSRFIKSQSTHQPRVPLSSRDGGSTASTSGTDEVYPLMQLPLRITGVEVIGARQKQGDISLSERLVGVKEYTVYRIRVWNGEENWEVERRYRDFFTLYRQLKKLYHDKDFVLPPPWSSVERESRKIFGNASPDVIAERSILIQECLQSVIHSKISSSSLNALIHFLSPSKANISSPSSPSLSQSLHSSKGTDVDTVSTLGKTISLVVHLRPYKSVKQLLEVQHYTCAGCHKNFDEGKTRMKELVQTLGWGKPRLCEYSGQLFCLSCHNNDTAVLPASVLHLWDFTQYTVSQLSKSYLDSIFDKPMLCVSAVNPHLFSRVPALQRIRNVRKRIGAMLPFVRCPFRRSIQKGLGSRRYLLESSDFFALRDLIDLSKGMFAALPVIVETVSRTILEHITEQCLICCDSGIPCNSKQACNDPSALIFPFQEEEVEKCRICNSVFHRHCFERMVTCSCGAFLRSNEAKGLTGKRHDSLSDTNSARKETDASAGFVSILFSKVMAQRKAGREETPKDRNTVILMGSLPSTSL